MGQERSTLPDGSVDFGNGVIGPSTADVEFFNSLTEKLPIGSASNPVVSGQFRVEPQRLLIPKALRGPLCVAMAVGGIGLVVACGGAKGEELTQTPESFRPTPVESPIVNPTGISPTATAAETPTVIKPPETGKGLEPLPTATATAELPQPKPVPPEEAKPILSVDFEPTTPEKVIEAINLVYKIPGVVNIKSQGLTFTREDLDRPLSFCLSGDIADKKVACAGLVRIFYDFHIQTGLELSYDAAKKILNLFRTQVPNEDSGGLSFLQIVKSELELNKLPTK